MLTTNPATWLKQNVCSFFFRKNWLQDPCAIPTFTKPKICQIRAPCILEGDVGSAFKRKLAPRFSLRQPKVSLLCKEKQAPRPFYETIECGSSKQSNHLHFRQVKPSIVSNVFFSSKLFKLSWALLLLIHCSGCPPCKILHTGRVVCRANGRGVGTWYTTIQLVYKFAFSLEI